MEHEKEPMRVCGYTYEEFLTLQGIKPGSDEETGAIEIWLNWQMDNSHLLPEQVVSKAKLASWFEHVMRGLNTDVRQGIISEDEYIDLVRQAEHTLLAELDSHGISVR